MSEWISVKDRLPEEDIPVLVFIDETSLILMGHIWQKHPGYRPFWKFDGLHPINHTVTHWMPLPDPPSAEKER